MGHLILFLFIFSKKNIQITITSKLTRLTPSKTKKYHLQNYHINQNETPCGSYTRKSKHINIRDTLNEIFIRLEATERRKAKVIHVERNWKKKLPRNTWLDLFSNVTLYKNSEKKHLLRLCSMCMCTCVRINVSNYRLFFLYDEHTFEVGVLCTTRVVVWFTIFWPRFNLL